MTLLFDTVDATNGVKGKNYFREVIDKLDEIKAMPFIGDIVGPYVAIARSAITNVNNLTDGSFGAIFNSIMPCNISNLSIRCEGTLDKDSARQLAKKLLSSIPLGVLPSSMASIIKLATNVV
ncbi:uncharacterized protein LOC106646524 [Copidosoma floridanum]|uniref:uncharacterized protein LOC106646524 n=1 Tax=Copidosoma floridanum TaxID=29053 RepID=UPI0006C94A49|nr:uncharacterized protein LOC106646524 [Copidosoma floridanum]